MEYTIYNTNEDMKKELEKVFNTEIAILQNVDTGAHTQHIAFMYEQGQLTFIGSTLIEPGTTYSPAKVKHHKTKIECFPTSEKSKHMEKVGTYTR